MQIWSVPALLGGLMVLGANGAAEATISNAAAGVSASETRYRTPDTGGASTPNIAQNNDTLQTLGAAVTISPSSGYAVGEGEDWRDAGSPTGVGQRADIILRPNEVAPPPVDFTFNNLLAPGETRRLDSIGVIVIDTVDDRRMYNFDIQYSTPAAPTTFITLFSAIDNQVPSPNGTHITATFTGIDDVKTIRLVSRLPFSGGTVGQNTYFNEIDINLTTIPEPASVSLMALAGCLGLRRSRSHR